MYGIKLFALKQSALGFCYKGKDLGAQFQQIVHWNIQQLPSSDGNVQSLMNPLSLPQTTWCVWVVVRLCLCAQVKQFLMPPMRGVVLQSYGAGNGPSTRQDLMDVLREASDRGVLIVNITQCSRGMVSTSYESGKVGQCQHHFVRNVELLLLF